MRDVDAAWLAGFLDGEGHIGIHPARGYYQVTVFMRNTHEASVRHAVALLEQIGITTTIHHETRARGRDSWFFNVSSNPDVLRVAEVVSLFSVTKREQWRLITKYTRSRLSQVGHRKPYSEEDLEDIRAISALNKRWAEPVAVVA